MSDALDASDLVIAAVAKDEFLGLIDWVAWHLSQGFSRVFVVNNESSDGTTALLEALQELRVMDTIEIPGVEGGIQEPAYELVVRELQGVDTLVAFVDVDEYFVSHDDLTVAEHLRTAFSDGSVSAVLVNWRVFGTGGRRFSDPDAVVLTHFSCAPVRDRWQHQVKTVVRIRDLDRMRVHVPQLKSGAGRRIHVDGTAFSTASSTSTRLVDGFSARYVQGPVTLHHYVVRSLDDMKLHKDPRGSAATRIDDPAFRLQAKSRSRYLEKYDRSEDTCFASRSWEAEFLKCRSALVERLVGETNLCRAIKLTVARQDSEFVVSVSGAQPMSFVDLDAYIDGKHVTTLRGETDVSGSVSFSLTLASNLTGSEHWRFRLRGSLVGTTLQKSGAQEDESVDDLETERALRLEAYRLMLIERDRRVDLERQIDVLRRELAELKSADEVLSLTVALKEAELETREGTLKLIYGSRRWRYWSLLDRMRRRTGVRGDVE